jgi:NADH-quinone oxidoreductase subunit F
MSAGTTLTRIATPAELDAARAAAQAHFAGPPGQPARKILVCLGGGCLASGSQKVKTALEEALREEGLAEQTAVIGTGCLGPCVGGPALVMWPDKVFYQKVTPADAREIVRQHVRQGEVVQRLTWRQDPDQPESAPIPVQTDIEFFRRQVKIVLRNCGLIDPTSIHDYFRVDGYQGLAQTLRQLTPEQVIAAVKEAGLRGRGGAGFPTWLKWSLTRQSAGDTKYILCNADEGDPGAFMDRSVLEGDPHSVIEGMAIGAYAIGARQGYVYVRAEYPLAVARLREAIDQARACGLLGERVLGTDFSFDLDIRMGSGAFVCGEETALMASVEGRRGEPRPRPPFPAVQGLWGKPTVLNNVETFANIPYIITAGGAALARYGTARSKGTKVFALAGKIANAGLVEVPVGTTLGELLYDLGGGIPNGKKFKAAQIGGPSGGCIPKQHLNVPLDYESLAELGAIMGSGGLVVMDEDSCMVDVARYFLEFVQEESCGKCVPCRVGTKRMLEILQRICAGQGELADIERLETLGRQIKDTSLCGLGQTAPNPVLSTIRHFRAEYEAHIRDKHCEAGVCPGLTRAPCQSACPANVDIPGFVALVGEQRYAEALRLHRERNPFAAVCARVCFHTCEDKCRRASLDEPLSIRGCKRFMADQEITIQVPEVRENSANAARQVAIVGAGPAGLSCAYFLARLGYRPKVLEAEVRPGGMLVQTIPAYRLPREILAREIRMIERLGVDIQTGQRLGRDFTLASLRQAGCEAVFLGIGMPRGLSLELPGADAEGVTDAIQFLRTYNLRGSVPAAGRIIVVGGGNAAIDAARTAIRLGAETVTIVYRRSQHEMPAYAEEIQQAIDEGVRLKCLMDPVEIVTEQGRVTGLRCRAMRLGEFDRSGRRRPEQTGEPLLLEADQIILGIGQALNLDDLREALTAGAGARLDLTTDGRLEADPLTGQTSVPWVFAGGDAISGPWSVVGAVASGEKAAVGMDQYLTGQAHAFWRESHAVAVHFDPAAEPLPEPRREMTLLAVERRKNNFDEVEQPWTAHEACRQAKRCLRCDYGKNLVTP